MTHSCVTWSKNVFLSHDSVTCCTWLIRMWHDSFMRDTRDICLICTHARSHPSMRHMCVFVCVMCLVCVCDMTHSYYHTQLTVLGLIHENTHRSSQCSSQTLSCVTHDSCICVTWLNYTCDMPHSCVTHDSFIRVTCLNHVCHDSFIRVTWLIHMCDMVRPYKSTQPVWSDSMHTHTQPCTMQRARMHEEHVLHALSFTCDTRPICLCNVTHLDVWHDSSMHTHTALHV